MQYIYTSILCTYLQYTVAAEGREGGIVINGFCITGTHIYIHCTVHYYIRGKVRVVVYCVGEEGRRPLIGAFSVPVGGVRTAAVLSCLGTDVLYYRLGNRRK